MTEVDTVPPPPGEDSVYDAPTKVGDVTNDAWAKLIADAERDEPKPVPVPVLSRASLAPPPLPADLMQGDALPRLYEEDDSAPTLLHAGAPRLPATAPPPPLPVTVTVDHRAFAIAMALLAGLVVLGILLVIRG